MCFLTTIFALLKRFMILRQAATISPDVFFLIASLIMMPPSTCVATITCLFPLMDVTGNAPVWSVYIVSAGSSTFKKTSYSLAMGSVSSGSSSCCLTYVLGSTFLVDLMPCLTFSCGPVLSHLIPGSVSLLPWL